MKINCPKCHSLISPENVNVATDVAMCPSCNEAFPISTLVGGKDKRV